MTDHWASRDFFKKLRDVRYSRPGYVAVGDFAFSSVASNDLVATENFQPLGPALTSEMRTQFEPWRQKLRKVAEFGMNIV